MVDLSSHNTQNGFSPTENVGSGMTQGTSTGGPGAPCVSPPCCVTLDLIVVSPCFPCCFYVTCCSSIASPGHGKLAFISNSDTKCMFSIDLYFPHVTSSRSLSCPEPAVPFNQFRYSPTCLTSDRRPAANSRSQVYLDRSKPLLTTGVQPAGLTQCRTPHPRTYRSKSSM